MSNTQQQLIEEALKKLEGRKIHELKSPRSLGDGDNVDVSAGYNQAIDDLKPFIENLVETITSKSAERERERTIKVMNTHKIDSFEKAELIGQLIEALSNPKEL